MTHIEYQKGVGLIEILITLLVLAIGILGLAALQTQALKNNESAFQRSQAVILSYAAFDMMRVNRVDALKGQYNISMTCSAPTGSSTLAAKDLGYWIGTIKESLGSDACGKINCKSTGDCTVTIQWNEERATRATTDASSQTLSTQTRL